MKKKCIRRPDLRRLAAVTLIVVAASLGRSIAAQGPENEAGASAPAGTWPMAGGNAARTRNAATSLPAGPPKRDPGRTLAVKGTIEGEPVLWNDHLIVAERLADDRRQVGVYDLSTLRPIGAPKSFKTTTPLAPAVWNRSIVIRPAPDRLQTLRIARGGLISGDSIKFPAAVSEPLVLGNEVYVRSGTELARLVSGRRDTRWKPEGAYLGRPSLRGNEVFAIALEAGKCWLTAIDRRTAAVTARIAVGSAPARPDPEQDFAIRVGSELIVVTLPERIRRPDGTVGSTVMLRRRVEADGHSKLEEPRQAWTLEGEAGFFGPSLVFYVRDGEGVSNLAYLRGGMDEPLVLGRADSQRFLFRHPEQLFGAGDFFFASATGMQLRSEDVEGRSILVGTVDWKLDDGIDGSFFPAAARLLRLTADRRTIETWIGRAATAAADWHPRGVAGSEAPATATTGRSIYRNGEVRREPYRIDEAKGVIRLDVPKRKQPEEVPLDEVLLALDGEEHIVWWPSREAARQGLEYLDDDRAAADALLLARSAQAAGDAASLRRFMDLAAEKGGDADEITRLEKVLVALEKKTEAPDQAKTAAIQAEETDAAARRALALWELVRGLPAEAPADLRLDLTRTVLAIHPGCTDAAAAVRAAIPPAFLPEQGFEAFEWVDFAISSSRRAIRLVKPAPAASDGRRPSDEEFVLAKFRQGWRPDLIGVRSERLLLVEAAASSPPAADCIEMGELVCDTLERVFAGHGKPREKDIPLTLLLYSNGEEYRKQSARKGSLLPESTLGHFNPEENLSRMFIPARAGQFNDMRSTYVHELTHHWVHERCPMFRHADAYRSFGNPGFWVVEGFATMVAEFRWEVDDRKVEFLNPRATSLDFVASAEDETLIPWEVLLDEIDQGAWHGLAALPLQGPPVKLSWNLGMDLQSRMSTILYMQSAATCHYLFSAEEGRHRGALLEYLGGYYSGKSDLACAAAFGMPPAELGRRTRDWARQQVGH